MYRHCRPISPWEIPSTWLSPPALNLTSRYKHPATFTQILFSFILHTPLQSRTIDPSQAPRSACTPPCIGAPRWDSLRGKSKRCIPAKKRLWVNDEDALQREMVRRRDRHEIMKTLFPRKADRLWKKALCEPLLFSETRGASVLVRPSHRRHEVWARHPYTPPAKRTVDQQRDVKIDRLTMIASWIFGTQKIMKDRNIESYLNRHYSNLERGRAVHTSALAYVTMPLPGEQP